MRFFTSDWHLGSTNILKYANRPFPNANEAAYALTCYCNAVAKWKTDVVFHVGDFWLSGKDRHDDVEDENTLDAYCKDYINVIRAQFILMSGNHDDGHNCESHMKSMVIDLNHNYRNVYVSHYPSDHKAYHGPRNRSKMSIVICGHVHDKWLMMYDKQNNVLNVNVSVDVWDYEPVRDAEITEMLDFMKTINVYDFPWKWDRATYDMYVDARKRELELGRVARKNERYAKKGLTPEICQQRKIEAMKKKGLIK